MGVSTMRLGEISVLISTFPSWADMSIISGFAPKKVRSSMGSRRGSMEGLVT